MRGQLQLASQAITAERTQAFEDGRITADEAVVDPADRGGWHIDYTPLIANWRYALNSRPNFFEDENQKPRNGSKNGIVAIYGVKAFDEGKQGSVPSHWADRSGRHLWWRFWGDLYGVNCWYLVLPVAILGALLALLGWRQLGESPDSSVLPDNS